MEAIILALIPGFFSLAGLWYQNYLNRKSKTENVSSAFLETGTNRHEEQLPAQPQNKQLGTRIFFTILITLLPWIIWKFLMLRLIHLIYEHMNTYATIMALYFFVWLIVTITAALSGWNLKTFFEKLILIVSSALLFYWGAWMIIVHHLL